MNKQQKQAIHHPRDLLRYANRNLPFSYYIIMSIYCALETKWHLLKWPGLSARVSWRLDWQKGQPLLGFTHANPFGASDII